MKPIELFNQGHLDESLAAARDAVKSNPTDANARAILAELLCFYDEFEKADTHLDTVSTMVPSLAVPVAQFRQIIRGAVARRDWASGRGVPDFREDANAEMKLRLRVAVCFHAGDVAEAGKLAAEAEAARKPLAGMQDDIKFDDLRDPDDILGSVLEVLTGDGRYFWLQLDDLAWLKIEAPTRPRDLLFRAGRVAWKDGREGAVFLPMTYPWNNEHADAGLRAGRSTAWLEDSENLVRGTGGKMLMVGEEGVALGDVRTVTFDGSGS
ncbi:MAG: type VI secretion system accessory protein TagJ [Phycisphaerae bacterium]